MEPPASPSQGSPLCWSPVGGAGTQAAHKTAPYVIFLVHCVRAQLFDWHTSKQHKNSATQSTQQCAWHKEDNPPFHLQAAQHIPDKYLPTLLDPWPPPADLGRANAAAGCFLCNKTMCRRQVAAGFIRPQQCEGSVHCCRRLQPLDQPPPCEGCRCCATP